MKTTIIGVLLDVTPDQDPILRYLMRKYGLMRRCTFQRLVGGLQKNVGGLAQHLANGTELPSRYPKDAVYEVDDLIRNRLQAMNDGSDLWRPRAPKNLERVRNSRSPPHRHARRIVGKERQISHKEERRVFYHRHVNTRAAPPVAFGSKKCWWDRFKILDDPAAGQTRLQAWGDVWTGIRNGRLFARGHRTRQGNPLLRVSEGPDSSV